ncbi:MAG: ribosomal protection-like ABC-F family protein [Planctomycetota bacterium]|nr:ATP-binding cassette domain-containing protein [Planctomycetota bacterium]
MPLVSASHVSMQFTGPVLLDDVTLDVEKGARIGMIGRNGSGKTTLLNILAGRLEPAQGKRILQRGVKVAYQEQELTYAPGATVLEEMRKVFADEARLQQRIADLEHLIAEESGERKRERLLEEYGRLRQRQDSAGVYDIDRRIETMLSSLGLPEETWEQPVEGFSGGERNIIGLAQVLLSDPDVMLLDEPSNHLDLEGVEWFIDFMRRSEAAVVMVSHNRHLLDAVITEIWELRHRKVKCWTGNYTDFQRQKAEAAARQERQYKSQQRLIQRIEFQARRLRDMARAYDDPGQAKRAKAMLRRIEQMDKVERPDSAEPLFQAALGGAARHGRIALVVNDFSFSYGDRVLFDGAGLEIEYGDRVCLVGPNGSGKTTLFRRILEEGDWHNQTLRLGKSVRVGEYRQLHDVLDSKATLQEWVSQQTGLTYSRAAALLHRFLFRREDLERRIATLSGGEKSRLQLAKLAHDQVNFLMLDEPTNHLDIPACEQLEEMLMEFEGTLFVISHDRYFLDKLVNRVVEVQDRRLVYHRRTFAAWWQEKLAARTRRRRGALERDARPKEERRDGRREFEERKQRRRELDRLRSRVKALETRIHELEARQEDLKRTLEEVYSSGERQHRAPELNREFDGVKAELATLYREWEALAASLGE